MPRKKSPADSAVEVDLVPAQVRDEPLPPKPFVGHGRVVEYFRRIGPEGLAHAYLFHGPRGVGKTTLARIIALTLHCERPRSFPLGFCGECGACKRGIAGSSGDTIFVDAEFIRYADEQAGKQERKTDTFGIETSRLIVKRMQMRSYEGGRLVCIIPDFENVPFDRDEVYNALLKELEEPDPGKLFVITTEQPERILPTIRSRALLVRFDPLREDDVARALVEHYGETKQRAASLARRSQGSLGDALADREEELSELRASARDWVLACLSRPFALPPMPTLGKDDPRGMLDETLRHARSAVRDLMAFGVSGKDAVVDVDSLQAYKAAASALGDRTAARAVAALAHFDEALRIAGTNVPPASVLGWLQVQLRSM